MKVKPVDNFLLVLPCKLESKSKGGIILPGNSDKTPLMGTVVAVGENVNKTLKAGMTVLWEAYSEKKIISDDQEHFLLKDENILGTVDEI